MDTSRHIKHILKADHGHPFDFLGAHPSGERIVIRAFLPEARHAWIIRDGVDPVEMRRCHHDGFFECRVTTTFPISYRIRVATHDNHEYEFHDPYSFGPVLSDFDLHLFGEGTHYQNYEKLGSHIRSINGIRGVHFAVWAPNAQQVSVVGDFNRWDGRRHPMRMLGGSGIWELFIPGLDEGTVYKYEVKGKYHDYRQLKADPFSFFFEMRPKTAAVVYDIDNKHSWEDAAWMEERSRRNWLQEPVSIYELHPGSWMRCVEEENRFLTYRELAHRLVPHMKNLGFTHVELMPVCEHPFDGSWGYQPIGYYAPTSRFGTPADFMYFVDHCHRNGIGVLVDWVPAHFPKDAHGLATFDGTCLYEHEDPRQGEYREWGTLIFNFGRHEVANYLIGNALFWLDKYHIDGLRVDAVAAMLHLDYSRNPGEWVPNIYGGNENLEAIAFIRLFNEVVHQKHPGVLTIAEESTSWPGVSKPVYLGGLGFSMKWNMGWMHDTLDYFSKDPIHRKFHAGKLTFSLLYAFSENFVLPFSHDEVVYGKRSLLSKMPGDTWQQFANLRALLGYLYGHPGKKLLFMGAEFGQWNEWNHDQSLDWNLYEYDNHRRLSRYLGDVNALYRHEKALHENDYDWQGFEWIDINDTDNCVISFFRKARSADDFLVFILNLTPVPRMGYRVGVPRGGWYAEVLNSDSQHYGGSNMGNNGGAFAEAGPSHARPFSLVLTLPPLSCVVFKPSAP
jgi:1,4-alpha-glucan branching enzyme